MSFDWCKPSKRIKCLFKINTAYLCVDLRNRIIVLNLTIRQGLNFIPTYIRQESCLVDGQTYPERGLFSRADYSSAIACCKEGYTNLAIRTRSKRWKSRIRKEGSGTLVEQRGGPKVGRIPLEESSKRTRVSWRSTGEIESGSDIWLEAWASLENL